MTPAAPAGLDLVHTIMFLELRRYMHNQLLRDSDVFGMSQSLEIRVPLIDHRIADLLFQAAPEVILEKGPKGLLLGALPSPLPRVCTHRPKMGFTLPFDTWMRRPWRPMIEKGLLAPDDSSCLGALFNPAAVASLWRNYLGGRVYWSRPWAVYVARRNLMGT